MADSVTQAHNDSPDDCSKKYKLRTTDNDLFLKAFLMFGF